MTVPCGGGGRFSRVTERREGSGDQPLFAPTPGGHALRRLSRWLRWLWLLPLLLAPAVDIDSVVTGVNGDGIRAAQVAAWLVGVVVTCVIVQLILVTTPPTFASTVSGLRPRITVPALGLLAVSVLVPVVLEGRATLTIAGLWSGLVLVGVLAARSMAVRDLLLVAAAAVLVVLPVLFQGEQSDGTLVTVVVTGVVIAAALGLQVREQRRRVVLARAAAVHGERVAMARELHDSVAHELTGILVLARANLQAGPVATRTDPTEATETAPGPARADRSAEAFRLILESAERALAEIRTLVQTIAADETTSAAAPSPSGVQPPRVAHDTEGRERLVELVRAFDAGTTATVEADIAELRLTPSAWLTLHRVCAEALTNIRRHAGSAERIVVRLGRSEGLIQLEVIDDGRGDEGIGGGSGTGLAGARRRLAALGGGLDAGRAADGRWRLLAWFPVTDTEPSAEEPQARKDRR